MSGLTLKFKKVLDNTVLLRKEMVFHPGKPLGKITEGVQQALMNTFKIRDAKTIVLYGFESKVGGNVSTGYCCIYKNMDALKATEPTFRQIRMGLKDKPKPCSRKQIKTGKNKALKKFGTHVKKEKKDKK